MENQSGGSTKDKGILVTTWVDLEEEFSVYAIGNPLDEDLNWKFYHNGACDKEIDGTMELISTEIMTFKDLVMSEYDSKSGILDYDWYNAIVSSFKYHDWTKGAIHSAEVDLDVSDMLMRWYQYEITLEPKQTIVNVVTAPTYPSINSDYEPAIFEYTYLLSPAKTWKEFGNLDIVINTPYYLIENSIEGFEYNNPGYELHLTGLPEEVGTTYKGKTLFTQKDGKYTANYEESMKVLEYLFPKDKNIFLMCGGGGYAGMTKSMLVELGWNADKIYNTGGYWYYQGTNNVIVKNDSHKKVTYDFWKVAYHDIDFSQLHEVK